MIEKTNSNPIRNTDTTRFVPDEFKKVARDLESQFSELMFNLWDSMVQIGNQFK